MDIQKYINPTQDPEPIFHSSAYAQVAHGASIGSTDTQTFQDRQRMQRNRQAVRRYGDSLIGRGGMRETARTQISNPLRQSEKGTSSRQQFNQGVQPPRGAVPTAPRPAFREPPTRGGHPYV